MMTISETKIMKFKLNTLFEKINNVLQRYKNASINKLNNWIFLKFALEIFLQ